MTYATLALCKAAQPMGSIRARLHYVKLPSGRWCATYGPPAHASPWGRSKNTWIMGLGQLAQQDRALLAR